MAGTVPTYGKGLPTSLFALLTCLCGGTGIDTTLPTNTVRVPITTGTVTDSGSEYTGFYWGDKSIYNIYTRQVNCERWPVDRPRGWNAGLTNPGPMCGGGRGEV